MDDKKSKSRYANRPRKELAQSDCLLWSVQESADHYGVSTKTINQWNKDATKQNKKFIKLRAGVRFRVCRTALERFLTI